MQLCISFLLDILCYLLILQSLQMNIKKFIKNVSNIYLDKLFINNYIYIVF